MSAAVDDRDDDVPIVLPGLRFGRGHRLLGLIKRYRRAIVTNTFMNGGLRRDEALAAGKVHVEPPSPSSYTSLHHLHRAAGYLYVSAPPGSRTVNTDPLPISLATVTSPPIRRASLRVMARPSPVPPKRCAVVASAWLNSSNSLACCSAVMPIPVSATASSIQSRPLA